MKIVLFYHSALSCWNHGNAHFLRGVVSELAARGHDVRVYEDEQAWSVLQLVRDHGAEALREVRDVYPALSVERYQADGLELDEALDGADLVIVHEWSSPELVERIGRERARGAPFRLLFHDTHHRAVSAPDEMMRYDLSGYDGVLAFGEVLRELYVARGWGRSVFTWHEAADTRIFRPLPGIEPARDVVWIGNWGDDERTQELHEFLLEPVRQLGLIARVHGVRYPETALAALADAGIEYGGWLPNYRAPEAFAAARVTVHVPRRYYAESLPGIPTIRPFEALACGIPLLSAPWRDSEGLFRPGEDFVQVTNGSEMARALRPLLNDRDQAQAIARSGRRRILERHTCAHRVNELLAIHGELLGTERMEAESTDWRRDETRI